MGTGPGPGRIPDPNPNPNHASDAKYEHPNSHDRPNSKLKQAYFVCGDERVKVPLPHPKGWVKGKPAKTTGKAYHANQWYRKKAKQGSKPCTPKSCDRRSVLKGNGNRCASQPLASSHANHWPSSCFSPNSIKMSHE